MNPGKRLAGASATFMKGMCMGSADIVPGVSGGTMALILGIYERLLRAIRSFDKDWLSLVVKGRFGAALSRNDLPFLAALGAGILAALLFFTHVVPLPKLIVSHPEQVYGLFFGLILASVVILMGAVERYGFGEVAMTLLGVAAGFAIVNLVPVETPDSAWFIFLCGFVAISAMLLPGISGSFILLILGKYAYIIDALGHFDLAVIAVFRVFPRYRLAAVPLPPADAAGDQGHTDRFAVDHLALPGTRVRNGARQGPPSELQPGPAGRLR